SYLQHLRLFFLSHTLCYFLFYPPISTSDIYTLSLHDALPIYFSHFPIAMMAIDYGIHVYVEKPLSRTFWESELMMQKVRLNGFRSEEHTSELQSRENLVCRLLLEKKKKKRATYIGGLMIGSTQ